MELYACLQIAKYNKMPKWNEMLLYLCPEVTMGINGTQTFSIFRELNELLGTVVKGDTWWINVRAFLGKENIESACDIACPGKPNLRHPLSGTSWGDA